MALYAISDLHLSFGTDKPMDVFGGKWTGYMEKLKNGFSVVKEDDTIILMGDLSWALSLEEAQDDFAWINSIPGRKIVLKGNHDYWWNTVAKFNKFCTQNEFENIFILNNNHFEYDGWAICGTRGWFFEENASAQDEKVFKRELIRLETSLKSAGDLPKKVFLHYPPKYKGYECKEIIDLLHNYDVRSCYYGHLHGGSHGLALEGVWDGIDYKLLSADKIDFTPFPVIL